MFRPFRTASLAAAVCVGLVGTASLAAPDVPAAAADATLLSAERWRDGSYGLSFLPPRGATALEGDGIETLVQYVGPESRYTLTVTLVRSERDLALDKLREGRVFALTTQASVITAKDEHLRPAGRPGLLTTYLLRGPDGIEWILSQLYLKIDPHTVASFELHSDAVNLAHDRKLLDAVINSIELADPAELDRVRAAWIKAGERWHAGVDRAALKRAMTAEQWFRIVDNGVDVGYMRVRHSLDTMLGVPGIKVDVSSRVVVGSDSFDTVSFFWESDDTTSEVWSVRTARRTLAASGLPTGNALPPEVYEETGLRSTTVIDKKRVNRVTVERKLPGDVDRLEWATPPEGYLSQVESHLIPSLLPRDAASDFGFYAYSSQVGSLTLRTIQAVPAADGGYVVRERVAPDRPEQISTYDRTGRLVRRQMPDGREIRPATPDQMRAIWDIR